MAIKDSVLAWFVKEYIIPNAQVLDKPGFIIFNISGKTPLKVRQTIMPENFFINLEQNSSKALGQTGEKILYSIGKKFGYSFGIMGGFLTKKDTNEKKLVDYIKLVNKFIEGTYASQIDGQTEYANSKVIFYLKNFVVCNKIGRGFFLPLGAGTGLVSKLMEDPTVEGIHLDDPKNSGPENCIVISAPVQTLKKDYPNEKIFTETNMNNLELNPLYSEYNKVCEIKTSNHSFRKYLETGFFRYDHGIVTYKEYRYIIFEVTGLYLLSIGFEENNASKILFDSAFDSGKEIIKSYKISNKNPQAMIDILTAFGWGEITINKINNKIILDIKHFPWTKYAEKTEFTLFKGYFSGILSGFTGREILFKSVEKNIQNNSFELIFKE